MGMPPMSGTALDLSGSGLRIHLKNPIPCGSPVKVETKQMLMLGEVCRCEPDANGYELGLTLFHSLTGLDDLERLNRALLGEETRRVPTAVHP